MISQVSFGRIRATTNAGALDKVVVVQFEIVDA
jgi:hypothetical protein